MGPKECGLLIYKFVHSNYYSVKIKVNSKKPIIKKVRTIDTNYYKRFYFLKNTGTEKMNIILEKCIIEFVVNNERYSLLINEPMTIHNIINYTYKYINNNRNLEIDDYCCNLMNFNVYEDDILLADYDKEFIRKIINQFNFGNGLNNKFIDIVKMYNHQRPLNITKISFTKIPSMDTTIITDIYNFTLKDIIYEQDSSNSNSNFNYESDYSYYSDNGISTMTLI
jgi:hypothetical protein